MPKKNKRKNASVRINQQRALKLLDIVDTSIRWASVSMVDKDRYYAAGNAMWSLAYLISGDRSQADRLERKANDHYAHYLANLRAKQREEAMRFTSRQNLDKGD
ncbi:hypothetical protein [Acetobacter persici]|uniref:Uncharacterized protein n=1 Tax=Acetobacter persici TaxID=1076596 RepID=A0A1U9LJ60_9PROT|nr:hypothetical protein [Acetobacter persici]AQT06493.1 hypothetical protein A0U91_15900 [Acetobacter persici]